MCAGQGHSLLWQLPWVCVTHVNDTKTIIVIVIIVVIVIIIISLAIGSRVGRKESLQRNKVPQRK